MRHWKDATEAERKLLKSLASMRDQYLTEGNSLGHLAMSAGRHAIELLIEHGLVTPGPRGGNWTEGGEDLLKHGRVFDDD